MKKHTKLFSAIFFTGLLPFTAQASDDFEISTKGGLSIKKTDGSAAFKLGGRVQWDYDTTSSDSTDEETFEIRRARLAAKGYVGNWGYKIQVNFGEGRGGDVADLYANYTGFGKGAEITIGRFNQPFGLEVLTSANYISMIERTAATEAFGPGRSGGIKISGVSGKDFTYAAGLFRDPVGDEADDNIASRAFVGRVTYAPINNGDSVLHLGAATKFGEQADSFGLEAATVLGSFHAQAEYMSRDEDDADDTVDTTYVQLGYIFTGETRPYKGGTFKGIKPKDGTAIEAVIRYENGFGKYADVGLGTDEGSQLALGLNFYPNNHARISMSYMDASTDTDNLDGDEFRLRVQFVF